MKTLLLATFLLCCTATYARPIAVTPNTIGGYTILDSSECKTNKKYLQAYATDSKDDVTEACWYVEGNDVVFVPKSGTLRTTPLDRFEIIVTPLTSKKNVRI